ncbi:MAG: hypothetical protein M1416_00700 [Candidatus Pacearchaeota archaeon]|nr:hypothetical protein [Candidatus Pacearchaeota archaeon]
MEKGRKKKFSGRNLALTIIIGVFIAIMIITLFNLVVTYFYEEPQYDDFCKNIGIEPYPIKYGTSTSQCLNCTFSPSLQAQVEQCMQEGGMSVYNYNDEGCTVSLKMCDFCAKDFDNAVKTYNRNTFFIYAAIGFAMIVAGLFIGILLIQIIALPAGAFLVIEAAVKNFDDKLYIIITFSLLIVAAIYLALKKLGNR